MNTFDAIILAGGMGTRLKEAIGGLPKCLAPVDGRPFLDILLDQLKSLSQIKKIILSLGYSSETVLEKYRGQSSLLFSVEDRPLGTAGALKKAVQMASSESVLVLNGDTYVDFDLARMAQIHAETDGAFCLAVSPVEDTGRYGAVEFDSQTGKINQFREKKEGGLPGWINAGVFLIRKDVCLSFPDRVPLSMERDILPGLITKGLYVSASGGKFIDIGTPDSYRRAQTYL